MSKLKKAAEALDKLEAQFGEFEGLLEMPAAELKARYTWPAAGVRKRCR